jgi:hypothetical protein
METWAYWLKPGFSALERMKQENSVQGQPLLHKETLSQKKKKRKKPGNKYLSNCCCVFLQF